MQHHLQTFRLKIVTSINLHSLGCQILDLSVVKEVPSDPTPNYPVQSSCSTKDHSGFL